MKFFTELSSLIRVGINQLIDQLPIGRSTGALRALCGRSAGALRALCGHSAGALRALYNVPTIPVSSGQFLFHLVFEVLNSIMNYCHITMQNGPDQKFFVGHCFTRLRRYIRIAGRHGS
jgi:hypothetical protein